MMAPLSKLMEVLDGCSVGYFDRTAPRFALYSNFTQLTWL
jgi:hypothetical protein